MSEDVASRVAGAEALTPELRERVERAAARLGSIHERWLTPMPAEPIVAAVEASASSSPDDALPLDADAVSVTPILGIETDESDDAGRPRFKTLMGVPRSSPEIDDLAGLDSPIERPALRSLPAAASSERASSRVDEAPSLAGTSLPWESGAPPSPSTRCSARCTRRAT